MDRQEIQKLERLGKLLGAKIKKETDKYLGGYKEFYSLCFKVNRFEVSINYKYSRAYTLSAATLKKMFIIINTSKEGSFKIHRKFSFFNFKHKLVILSKSIEFKDKILMDEKILKFFKSNRMIQQVVYSKGSIIMEMDEFVFDFSLIKKQLNFLLFIDGMYKLNLS